MLVRHVDHADRAVAHRLGLLPEQMEEPRVVQGVGDRVRMLQLGRDRHSPAGTLECAVGKPALPGNEGRTRVARDPRVRSQLEALRAVWLRFEALDALLQVLEATLEVVRERKTYAEHQVRVD